MLMVKYGIHGTPYIAAPLGSVMGNVTSKFSRIWYLLDHPTDPVGGCSPRENDPRTSPGGSHPPYRNTWDDPGKVFQLWHG